MKTKPTTTANLKASGGVQELITLPKAERRVRKTRSYEHFVSFQNNGFSCFCLLLKLEYEPRNCIQYKKDLEVSVSIFVATSGGDTGSPG